LKREFELRIFVSLGIVGTVCLLCATLYRGSPSLLELLAGACGLDQAAALRSGYLMLALVMALVSAFRMWAGSALTARRVMAFRVQTDALRTSGPYTLVRNPIYLADYAALCGFALCLPPAGIMMPVLFLLHYLRLIRYEERSLKAGFGSDYEHFTRTVPRIFPNLTSLKALPHSLTEFHITPEAFRHNALYVLFVPGFIVASLRGDFSYAALIGLPGVVDWAIVHTRIGVRP
jgi:protein-S-isoprenylcysteine O-methyltransferase Ste14